MRWRTCEEEPYKAQDCLIMLKDSEICMVGMYLGGTWYAEYPHSKDEVEKWCPIDEIVSALNTGDPSDAEQHEDDAVKRGKTLEQMLKLDAVHIPSEPTVDVYDPDGFFLCRTDDPIRFMRIRLGIKKLGLKGYTVKTGSGDVHEIAANGKVVDYPDGELPGDIYGSILQELVSELHEKEDNSCSTP